MTAFPLAAPDSPSAQPPHVALSSRPAGGWGPLLDGPDRDMALAAVREIARALDPALDQPWRKALESSLGTGRAGISLFYTYMHLAFPDQGYDEAAERWLDEAQEEMSHVGSLYAGFTGPTWLIAHQDERLFDIAADDAGWSEEVDASLVAELEGADRSKNWDLVKGLAGSAVYFAERLPEAIGKRGLAAFVDYAARVAEITDRGASWRFAAEAFFFAENRENYPDGIYNLTVGHGTVGVLTGLAAAVAGGVNADTARRLLDSGMRWYLDHELPDEAPCAFPMSYAVDDPERGGWPELRLAWCRGDVGIAATLFTIAEAAGNAGWREIALRVARRAATRQGDDAKVGDPGLCHGSAGLAHLFHRMYRRTGDPALAAAARAWYRETLAYQRSDRSSTGGFWSWQHASGTSGPMHRRPEPGFLLGAAGVGLALLAAITDIAPDWDRLLLASLPHEPG